MLAQVIVLAGPSGAGKSRLARRLGLPVLRLDDFYKDGTDPTLPRFADGPRAGLVDWDHPGSWLAEDALSAIGELCREGSTQVPVYEIARDGRVGWQGLGLGEHRLFVAEGIFAPDVVAECRRRGWLAAAYCLTQRPSLTFTRRLVRDLRERRKPPAVLIRRGLALRAAQPAVVAAARARGCEVATGDQAYARLRGRLAGAASPRLPWGESLRQPDGYSCGAASVVVARMLRDGEFAAETLPRYDAVVRRTHRRLVGPLSALRRPQLPWPRHLGTPGWAVASALAEIEGHRFRTHPARWRPGRGFDRLHRAASAGRLAALYVGSPALPRHVTLITGTEGDALTLFDPATGDRHTLRRDRFVRRRLGVAGWDVAWAVVVPTGV